MIALELSSSFKVWSIISCLAWLVRLMICLYMWCMLFSIGVVMIQDQIRIISVYYNYPIIVLIRWRYVAGKMRNFSIKLITKVLYTSAFGSWFLVNSDNVDGVSFSKLEFDTILMVWWRASSVLSAAKIHNDSIAFMLVFDSGFVVELKNDRYFFYHWLKVCVCNSHTCKMYPL